MRMHQVQFDAMNHEHVVCIACHLTHHSWHDVDCPVLSNVAPNSFDTGSKDSSSFPIPLEGHKFYGIFAITKVFD